MSRAERAPQATEGAALRAESAGGEPSGGPSPLEERFAGQRSLHDQRGKATYYGDQFAGRSTASGERYDPRAFTAAHRTLPFGTIVRVVRIDGSRSVVVRVTDRGPFGSRARIVDLSRVAAERLGMIRLGVVDVRLEVLEYGPPPKKSKKKRRRR